MCKYGAGVQPPGMGSISQKVRVGPLPHHQMHQVKSFLEIIAKGSKVCGVRVSKTGSSNSDDSVEIIAPMVISRDAQHYTLKIGN